MAVNGVIFYYSNNIPVVGAGVQRFIAVSLEAVGDGIIWHSSHNNNNNTYQTSSTPHSGWVQTERQTIDEIVVSGILNYIIGAGTKNATALYLLKR